MSFVGEGAFVMGCDVANSYIGPETAIFAPALYNVVFGERGLLGGAGGFADFLVGSGAIVANIAGKKVPSNLRFLGSAVGDDCFVGTNMIFSPGQTIPDGTKVFDHGLVKFTPTTLGRQLCCRRIRRHPSARQLPGKRPSMSHSLAETGRSVGTVAWWSIEMLWESISNSVVDQGLSTHPAIVSDEAELTYGRAPCGQRRAGAMHCGRSGWAQATSFSRTWTTFPRFSSQSSRARSLVRRSRRSTSGRRTPRSRASSR